MNKYIMTFFSQIIHNFVQYERNYLNMNILLCARLIYAKFFRDREYLASLTEHAYVNEIKFCDNDLREDILRGVQQV